MESAPAKARKSRSAPPKPKPKLNIDKAALKRLKLVAVAYSHVRREDFPTQEAYDAEVEVEERAQQVITELEKLGIQAKGYAGNEYLLSMLHIDDPDVVLNLVDTLRGKDEFSTSIPAALELTNTPFTGAEMQGMLIGCNRNLIKQLLIQYDIPTPEFQFIVRAGQKVDEALGLPLIVKLNSSGGSVGIDNAAVKETLQDAQRKVDQMMATYKMPVVIERFIDGPEITAVVFDDGKTRHTFMGQKRFKTSPDGRHFFTSVESYEHDSYDYEPVEAALEAKIHKLILRAFNGLLLRDYAKFDIRVDEQTGTPYFTDVNPNTAFGPDPGLPMTELLAMYGVSFQEVLASLMTKYARKLNRKKTA